MKIKIAGVVALCLTIPALAADPKPAAQAPAAMTEEQMIAEFKADMFAKRADIMAKSLTLTAAEASKFWPQFDAYLKEQEPIINEQIEATKNFAAKYQALSDPEAVAYVDSLLERDQKITQLRLKWLKKFQEAVPARTAARVIHLDRRLSNLTQVQLSSQIPLVR